MNLFARKGKFVLDATARRLERAIAAETKTRVFSRRQAMSLIGRILEKSAFDAEFNVEAKTVTLRFGGEVVEAPRGGAA